MQRQDIQRDLISPLYLRQQLLLKPKGTPLKMDVIMGWVDGTPRHPTLKLTFEDLTCPISVDRLIRTVRGTHQIDEIEAAGIIEKSINKDTLTWTSDTKRTNWKDYWNIEVEEAWRASALYPHNKRLGYEAF
jgi:hypothetical protein